jgi:hypothetical protein
MAPLGPDVRVPDDLLEVRTMLLTRAEKWKQGWLEEGRQEGRQEGLQDGLQIGVQKGLQEGLQKGEATLLLRQLERRFGRLPDWAADRVRAADTGLLEEWGLRILDGGGLDDVLGEQPA